MHAFGLDPMSYPHECVGYIGFGNRKPLAITGRGLSDAPYMRAKTPTVNQFVSAIHGDESDRTFAAREQYGAGVFLQVPGPDFVRRYDESFNYKWVTIQARTYNDHLRPIPVVGRGPATISSAPTGNQLSTFQYIGDAVSSEGSNSLMFNEFVRVKPVSRDKYKPICFGVVICNDHTSNITNASYRYSISVGGSFGPYADAFVLHDV